MNKILKNNLLKILFIFFIGVLSTVVVYSLFGDQRGSGFEVKRYFSGNDISSAIQITCTFPQISNVVYLENEIIHEIPKPETNPLIFTFSKFEETDEVSQLSYVDATQTINTIPIIKFIDNDEKIMFIEGSGNDYLSIYFIYKKEGIATYSKSINLLGILPEVTSAMGSCVGY